MFSFFFPGVDASHVYADGAWALGCFHSLVHISTQLNPPSEGADRVGGQLLGDKDWRKVPESDARSVVGHVCETGSSLRRDCQAVQWSSVPAPGGDTGVGQR